jgi:hypothetical protein
MFDKDEPRTKRNTKGTKAKETRERNGGFSQKHVRLAVALAEARAAKGNSKQAAKN